MSGNIIQLNEDLIKNNLKDLVRDSVEETLNALLDHEADELVRVGKYERTGERKGYCSGHYERNFGTTNLTERVNREIRRRTRAIGAFPDGNSALMLVCARLRHLAASEWGSKRYMDMEHLFKMETEQPADEENPYI